MYIQLLCLFCLALIFTSFFENRKRRLAALFFTGFICLELASYFMTSEPVNFVLLHHLGVRNISRAFKAFQWWCLLGIIAAAAIYLLLVHLSAPGRGGGLGREKPAAAFLLTVLLTAMIMPGGILSSLRSVTIQWKAAQSGLSPEEALVGLGISPDEYVFPKNLQVSAGRASNLVIISLESFERAFLDRADLTPNLNRLASSWTYYKNFAALEGTFPTIASLYSWQMGLPFLFGTVGGDAFSDGTAPPRFSSLPLVLKAAGYTLHYVAAMTDFAGTESMMARLGYDAVKGRKAEDYPFPVKNSYYDHFDRDVFNLAKAEFDRLSAAERPFMLLVSTIDTHFPAELYDPGIPAELAAGGTESEGLIRWTDQLVYDFVSYIEARDKETVIMIMPDHLSFRLPDMLDGRNRGLYLLSNADERKLRVAPETAINHLYLPRMVLNAAGQPSNVKFLPEILRMKGIDMTSPRWLGANREEVIKLNNSLWKPKG